MKARKKSKAKKGRVALVGAGPGDPGLMTFAGARLLRDAEVVIYDRLVNPALLALAPGARKIYAGKPQDSEEGWGSRRAEQKAIERLLEKNARAGRRVVRLKGGDPFVFGRGGEEASYLKKKKIPFEIVPGITAGHAVPAYAGIPVTDRRLASAVTFVTAHENPASKKAARRWRRLAQLDGTLVLFMGMRHLAGAARALVKGGKSPRTPVSAVEWGTLPRQRTVEGTLETIAAKVRAAGLASPAIIVVGAVNRLRRELAWFSADRPAGTEGPLQGKTVLVTRATAQAGTLSEGLRRQGARVIEFPTIRILPPADLKALDRALPPAGRYDWIFFTSPNGVAAVFGRLAARGLDARVLAGTRLAAIGNATARALGNRGLNPDFSPSSFTSEALVTELARLEPLRGKRILLPRTDIAPRELKDRLEALGARVTQVVAYRTGTPEMPKGRSQLAELLEKTPVDYVTFTSSSTVQNFFGALPETARKKIKSRLVSIGPVTSRTLEAFGYRPYREAREHTVRGLLEVMTHGS